MIEDTELLRRYAEERSEGAFAELVQRRVGLVYAVAVRQCGGDVHLAEDVTQRVFADLARKATALAARPVLSGWLYRSAQFAASDVVRSERRRRAREEENHSMNEISTGGREADGRQGVVDWEKLRPVLDEALGELGEEERDAVALRFFEEKSFAEIGGRLALSEEAARKRVSRAVGKLQGLLARRGVTSTEAALALVLANQAAAAVPAGLAASVTSGALAGAGLAGGAAAVGSGLAIFMGTTKLTVGVIGAVAVVGIGAAWWGVNRAEEARAALAVATQEQAALSAKLAQLESRVQVEAKRAEEAETDNANLLAAVAAAKASGIVQVLEEAGPITAQSITDRLNRIGVLLREGKNEEALREYIWLIDVGMVRVPEFRSSRYQSVAPMIQRFLAERVNYAPAREFLRQRRDELERQLRAGREDAAGAASQIIDFGLINRAMKEEERTLAAYDSLRANDNRRRAFGFFVVEQLIDARRYAEAMEFRTYSGMLAEIEKQEDMTRQGQIKGFTLARDKFLGTMGRNIEVLAGTGALTDVRTLAERLFAFDGSPETRALLQKHLERAGQGGLLKEAGK